jgi:hypothetical protein
MEYRSISHKGQSSFRPTRISVLLVCLTLLGPWVVRADESVDLSRLSWRKTPFNFHLGGFFPAVGSNVRLDSDDGVIGTKIDLESTGLDDSEQILFLGASYRFAKRHGLELSYFELDRSGAATVSGQIRFGDIAIGANLPALTEFNTEILRFVYQYSLFIRDSWELALLTGGEFASIEATISSDVLGITESESAESVFPLIGLRNYFRYSDNLFLQLTLEWMDLEINQINGTILNLNTSVQYDLMKNVGLGVGYKYIDIDVDSEKNNLFGGIVYRGPEVYLRLGF